MQATGIYIDGSILRWATVKWNGRHLRPVFGCTELDPSHVKQLYTEKGSTPLVSGLSCSDLIIRSMSFKAPPSRKLLQALILQVQTQLYFKPEEMITLAIQNAKEKQATIYSTTTHVLEKHLLQLKQAQLDPERVGAIPAALLAFIKWKAPGLHSYFLIDVGQACSNCLWVEKGSVQKAHDLKLGLSSLKSAFQEDRKKLISLKERDEIDFSALKSGQYPALAEGARIFRREISKLLRSFHCQRPIVFVGELEPNSSFKELLLETLRDYITEEIKLDLTAEEKLYAGCCGLAIDYLLYRKQPLQFRKDARLSSLTRKKLGRTAFGLLTASFLFCGTFYEIGSWWIDKRKNEIMRNLEEWAATKDPELRFELFSVGSKMEDLVAQWLKIIKKNGKEYPFLMKAPQASFFLSWLSNHPLINSFCQANTPVSFEQIHYQLQSFPHLEALHEPYLAKVEIEFKAASPLHARKLHEAFLEDTTLVDTSREITWDVLSDRYRTSFYLKNDSYDIF